MGNNDYVLESLETKCSSVRNFSGKESLFLRIFENYLD